MRGALFRFSTSFPRALKRFQGIDGQYLAWRLRRLLFQERFELSSIQSSLIDMEKSPGFGRRTAGLFLEDDALWFFAGGDGWREAAAMARTLDPTAVDLVLDSAASIRSGQVPLLGLGLVECGSPPVWHRAWPNGGVWPNDVASSEIDYLALDADPPTDVRLSWELNRGHQWVTLGQAYVLDGDPAHAAECRRQILDWIQENPVGLGINWVVAMEVAIRAVNLVWAFQLIRKDSHTDTDFAGLVLRSLAEHALFIERNLEISRIPNNHFLANSVGLIYLGTVCHMLPGARRWSVKGWRIFREQILKQFNPDGGNFESSVGYHRFGIDLCTSTLLLGERNGLPQSKRVHARLFAAVEMLKTLLDARGGAPDFGDNDDGLLLRLGSRPTWQFSHIIPQAMWALKRPLPEGFPLLESIFMGWKAGPRQSTVLSGSRAFPATGFYRLDGSRLAVIVDAGGVGMHGSGGHAHQDIGSIVLLVDGVQIVVDPGTYLYTLDMETRNRFRGSKAHNCVSVDDWEQRPWRSDRDPWGLREHSRPLVEKWISTDHFNRIVVSHRIESDVASNISVNRMIDLCRTHDTLVIIDRVESARRHQCKVRFHLSPECTAIKTGLGCILRHPGVPDLFCASEGPGGVSWRLGRSLISPAYGSVVESSVVEARWIVRENRERALRFSLGNFHDADSPVSATCACWQNR